MIEEKELSIENACLLLKHVGYWKFLKFIWVDGFYRSLLYERFEEMIAEEEEKKEKEKRNEKLLVDLCECYLFLSCGFTHELLSVCSPCLLKAASVKEESEENQKDVEMALLALSCIRADYLYLNDIKGIIIYHQEHHNLTRLAYQSVWEFLIYKLCFERSLEDVVANEMQLAREARRELEELTRCVDWKKKDEDKRRKEKKEEIALLRWIGASTWYLLTCKSWNEELVELMSCIVNVFGAAKENYREISEKCIESLRYSAINREVKIDSLLKGGAIETILEEMQRPTLNKKMTYECLQFFTNVSRRLKEKKEEEMEEAKRKATKMKMLEKLEEEGYEDIIASFHEAFEFLKRNYDHSLSLDISEYFVNV